MKLSESERKNLKSDIANYARTVARKGNMALSKAEMDENIKLCNEHFETLCSLKALMHTIYKEGPEGLAARIQFMSLIWLAGIEREINNYVFFDIFDVGSRQHDTVFEMGDSDDVMTGLVIAGQSNPLLRSAASRVYGEERWLNYEKLYGATVNGPDVFEILTYTVSGGYENVSQIDSVPQKFESLEAARAELEEHLGDAKEAYLEGHLSDEYLPGDYLIANSGTGQKWTAAWNATKTALILNN